MNSKHTKVAFVFILVSPFLISKFEVYTGIILKDHYYHCYPHYWRQQVKKCEKDR